MKHNVGLHSLFKKLNIEDIQAEDSSSLSSQVNMERIHQLTMEKVRKEKKEVISPFKKQLFKAAIVACTVVCIGGGTVFAATNKTVRETISSLLGISQSEILMVGESIKSKDYKLTVHEIVCDSYTGMVNISVEALSPKAKETFLKDNIIHKLGHLGSVGYGLKELEELQNEFSRYFSFSFNVHDKRHLDDGLTFSMEGISKKIKIPITQTIELSELDIKVPEAKGYSVSYQKLSYSEIGFTLLGTLENEEFDPENILITIEFMDGRISNFYHFFKEKDEIQSFNEIPASESQVSKNGSETSVTNTATPSEKNLVNDFDEEWFSGGGGYYGTEKVITTFSFSQKMDWSLVKSITINGITIYLN